MNITVSDCDWQGACQWRRHVGPLGLLTFREKVLTNWPAEMSAPIVEGNALLTGGAADGRQEGLEAAYSS